MNKVKRLILKSMVLALAFAAPVGADPVQQAALLAEAYKARDEGDWEEARAKARAAGAIAADIMEWHHLRAGRGGWEDYRDFLRRNADWPGLPLLKKRGEASIPENAEPGEVTAYFAGEHAQTGRGAIALAQALEASGKEEEAAREITRAWRRLSLSRTEQDEMLARWGELLKPHHAERLDMLLWRGLAGEARMMMPLLGKNRAALAEARIALRQNLKGVDDLIGAVPESLSADPGLAYERFLWRLRKGRLEDAAALILERSESGEALGQPERWANGRRQIARAWMRAGKAKEAYRIASAHHLESGSNFADLEWLSGYLALKYLDEPKRALRHFDSFALAVKTPISLGRAGYWRGRALEAIGRSDEARAAYGEAARHQTSFYGQLAAAKIGAPMNPELAGRGPARDWKRAGFLADRVLGAALMLRDAGQQRLATRFMVHLAESLGADDLELLADLALANSDPHSALMIAKHAARRGIILPRAYFPLHPLAEEELPAPPDLALAIARRESEFFTRAYSPAGAVGLMQVMPRTAKAMSEALGLEYSKNRLFEDWRYNVRIGAAYLARMEEEFGPNPILIAGAYNAGPGRVKKWIQAFGDPRTDAIGWVDWIEHIPFRETRNYVMRVAESLPVYRARLAGRPVKLVRDMQ